MRMRGPIAALLAATLLAGCGSSSSQSQNTQTQTQGSSGAPVPTITLVGPAEGWNAAQLAANRLIIASWKQLGVNVDMQTAPEWGTFTAMLKGKPWQASAAAYLGTAQRLDPELLLANPLMCHLDSNFGDYCNPKYDQLVEQANATMDQTKRKQLYDQAQEILAKDLPVIVEFYPNEEGLYNKNRVSGLVSAAGAGLFNFWNFINAQPVGGDTLKIGVLTETRTLNPFDTLSYVWGVDAENLIWDTLTRLDQDGKAVPWAAKSWDVKDDKTIVVHLRDDLKYTDGQPLTSADVAWSFMAFKQAKTPFLLSAVSSIDSVDTPDAQTAVFHMSKPEASLFDLAFATVPILPKHIWSKYPDVKNVANPNMTGSGPYKLTSFNATSQTVLDANPNYFQPPKAKQLAFVGYTNSQTFFLALQNGDVAWGYNVLINPSMVEQAKGMSQLGVISRPGTTVRWLTYNLRPDSPFANYAFREALSYAIDYPTIVQDVLKGTGTAGDGMIAPADAAWHDANVKFPQFDPAKAKQILKDAGYTWDGQGQLHLPANYKPQVLPS